MKLDVKMDFQYIRLRRNIKFTRVKRHKGNIGTSIDERPIDINSRTEFGHWEIDIVAKTANTVTDALSRVRSLFGE